MLKMSSENKKKEFCAIYFMEAISR